jgi:hypothetical protein
VGKIHRRTVAVKTKFHVTRTVRICKVSITGGQKDFYASTRRNKNLVALSKEDRGKQVENHRSLLLYTVPANKFGIRVGCDLHILTINDWWTF